VGLCQPLDFSRRLQGVAKSVLDSREHHITHHIAAVTAGRRRPAHRFTVTAIQGERRAQWLAVVAAKFEAIRTPALVALRPCDLAIVPTLRPWWRRSAL
jgi:hypothetical protein